MTEVTRTRQESGVEDFGQYVYTGKKRSCKVQHKREDVKTYIQSSHIRPFPKSYSKKTDSSVNVYDTVNMIRMSKVLKESFKRLS